MASSRKALIAEPLADFSPIFKGLKSRLAFGVSTDGTVVACAQLSDESHRVEAPHADAGFAKTRLVQPTEYILAVWKERHVNQVCVKNEQLPIEYVQCHPEGYLLVGARCRWRTSGAEPNALIVDQSGRVLRRFALGDGIADVRVGDNGDIVVSYYDEGVFGNYGWLTCETGPIGAPGLVRFDSRGNVLWTYDYEAAGTDAIADTYAMNVDPGGDIWVCHYTEFPLVRIRGNAYRVWDYDKTAPHALAVKGDRVLAVGDYGDSSRARVIELDKDNVARVVAKSSIQDSKGKLKDCLFRGVGDRLYAFREQQVLSLQNW